MSVATAAPTGTWAADKIHSPVGFEVDHMVSTFRGHFEDYDAQLGDGRLGGQGSRPSVKVYDETWRPTSSRRSSSTRSTTRSFASSRVT